jgi:sugar (pentulose or hexulose) kinase
MIASRCSKPQQTTARLLLTLGLLPTGPVMGMGAVAPADLGLQISEPAPTLGPHIRLTQRTTSLELARQAARGAWVGLTVRHRRAHIIRAVLEGITFGMRDQVEIMRSRGVKVSEVRASGGGAASTFWRQLQADMYKARVVRINTQEGGALGVALLAAVGTGEYSSVPEACAAA